MPKLTIVLRKDLALTPAKMAVQVGHAVDLAWLSRDLCDVFEEWLNPKGGDRRKVVLEVSTLEKLNNLILSLKDEGAICKRVIDSAYTELQEPTVTGIVVLPSRVGFKKLSRLRLYS